VNRPLSLVFSALLLGSPLVPLLSADADTDQARRLMLAGKGGEAKKLLEGATKVNAPSPESLLTFAEYQDQFRQPGAAAAYRKALESISDPTTKQRIERRIQVLEKLREPAKPETSALRSSTKWSEVSIPGPLRSFARMAALSPDLPADQLLTALGRNIVTGGYQASGGEEGLQQTEYLKLIYRYMSQARELSKLAGDKGRIVVPQCESIETSEILRVIGYRIRGGCGSDLVLETVNASRAFLTIDSGFPLADLEQALRTNKPFDYAFGNAKIPIMFEPEFWLTDSKDKGEFIDQYMADPQLCRLYLGLSKLDGQTAEAMRKGILFPKLKAFAHVIDFYGGMFQIRDGKAVISGGPKAVKVWTDNVLQSPDQGPLFFEKLIVKDDGWLASYYDAISRIDGPVKDYLLDNDRIKRYYTAIRGRITSPGPARPVFRANTDMIMLTSRLRLEPDGKAHIPGNLEIWRNLFIKHPHGKYDGKLTKLASGWKEPDDFVEALFALTRKVVDNEPLKIYMSLSDINRKRSAPLANPTVERLVLDFKKYGAQYPLLTEFPMLKDATIIKLLDSMALVDGVKSTTQKADAAGLLQASVGLWQIAARQQLLPNPDETLNALLDEFKAPGQTETLFDAGHNSVIKLLTAAGLTQGSWQSRMMTLLGGGAKLADDDYHQSMVVAMNRNFEQQRLVTLDTLFELDDDLEGVAKGKKFNLQLANKLTQRISEINLPRPALSSAEKNTLAYGYYTEKHIEDQRKFNLRGKIERAGTDGVKLQALRGELTPLLRDTLVGLNYVHYAPPGAQIMITNPLFVRSHDFTGMQGNPATWRNTEVYGTGWPSSAGGRLSGSLISLPYAIADSEQNFMIPTREQALIWGDLVPQMMITAKVPRWWNVSRAQLHYVSLNLMLGEELLAEAALNESQREPVLERYSRHASPVQVDRVRHALQQADLATALMDVQPSELFLMGQRAAVDSESVLAQQIRSIEANHKGEVNAAAISRAFGTPKPTLLHSYAQELNGLRTFPTLMGYSSRIMAESWESNLLYFAALADELQMEPSRLNLVIPEWTQRTVERIFATHLEDWPALLRSLRYIGDQVRKTGSGEPARASLN
jgi:hypothetical protein